MNHNLNSLTDEDEFDALPGVRSSATVFPDEDPSKNHKPLRIRKALSLWIHPFTRLHRIPVFRRVWFYLACVCVYTIIVDWIAEEKVLSEVFKEATNIGYLSAIFGLLLVFRTNSAYERWWEGRRLWGQLVNDSRNLCIKVKCYVDTPDADKARMGELIVSFGYALKHHLRDSRPSKALPGVDPLVAMHTEAHLPAHLAEKVMLKLQQWLSEGKIDEFKLLILDTHARAFMDICGACERIKSTPLAVSYRAFMRQGIALNLLIIPWYMIPQLGLLWSLPVVLIASYFLIGLELIAEDIEEPFGKDGDDLPLDRICNTIQTSVSGILTSVDRDKKYTTSLKLPDLDPLKYTTSMKAVIQDPLRDND